MELQEAILGRRSIRQFLPKPVPDELIKDLIAKSLWSPSWGNTQPWEIVVGTGESLAKFKKKNRDAFLEGKSATTDIPMPQAWPDRNKLRYKELGKSVLGALSIPREDQQARIDHFAWMFTLFDAPAMVLFTMDKTLLLEYAMLDVGLILQTFCLLAHDRGLGTCVLAVSVMYPEIAREVFSIPDTKRLVIGTALGWPDSEATVNSFKRNRGPLEEFVRWVK
nr:putative nitroreductase [uncultured bacterium]